MSECNNEIRELIPLFYDNELTKEEEKRVIEHVDDCEDCREELSFYEMCRQEFLLDDIEVPDGFHNKMMDKLRESDHPTKEITKKRNNPIKLYRKYNKYIGIAAAMAFVVLLGAMGINNIGGNKDSDDYSMAERSETRSESIEMVEREESESSFFDGLAREEEATETKSDMTAEAPMEESASDYGTEPSAMDSEMESDMAMEESSDDAKEEAEVESKEDSDVEIVYSSEDSTVDQTFADAGGELATEDTNSLAFDEVDDSPMLAATSDDETFKFGLSNDDNHFVSEDGDGQDEDDEKVEEKDKSNEKEDKDSYNYFGLLALFGASILSGIGIFIFSRRRH